MSSLSRVLKPTESPQFLRGSGSWLALLTATTIASRSNLVCAEVRADANFETPGGDGPHRLIVQVYPSRAVVRGHVQPWACPSGSAQRCVTQEELGAGLAVHLVDFGRAPVGTRDRRVVVAWVELGDPDLELDGIGAKPGSRLLVAVTPLRSSSRRVRLKLRALASA